MKATEVMYPEGVREEYLICKNWKYDKIMWYKERKEKPGRASLVCALTADGAIDSELRLQLDDMQSHESNVRGTSIPTVAIRPLPFE